MVLQRIDRFPTFRSVLLLLMLLGSLPASATSDQQLARDAMDALFRLQYAKAEQQIYLLSEQNPDYHMLAFLRAGVFWLKAEAEQSGIDHRPAWSKAAAAYDAAIQQAEEKLEQSPDSPQWRLALGMSQFYAARTYVGLGKIIKTYRYARAGRDTLRELIQTHPDSYDAYIALGLYEYIAGSIPRSLAWLAYLFDISGDREKGIQYLRLTVEKAPLMAAEGSRMLIAAAALQPEYVDDACQYIPLSRQSLKLFPQNPHFSGAYQFLHSNCGYAKLALKENRHARKAYLTDFPDMEKILNIVELRTQSALSNLPRIQQMKPLFKQRNTAYWHLAMGQYYDLQGKRQLALKHYHIIQNSQYFDENAPDVLSNSENKDWLLDQVDIYLKTPYRNREPYAFDPATSLKLNP
ncbi:MAG: hypothetical protein OEX12_13900 [Gammaproteobacteria bacterium]|nr:hypothetical protein [Gammaproteobacteria bacterium]